MQSEPELLFADEVADRLRLDRGTVYDLVRRGDLRAYRLGSGPKPRLRISSAELDRFLARNSTSTPQEVAA